MFKFFSQRQITSATALALLALIMVGVGAALAWHPEIDIDNTCQGWEVEVTPVWEGHPGTIYETSNLSGTWGSETSIYWYVKILWDNGEDRQYDGWVSKPGDCETPTVTNTPTPTDNPTEPPTETPTDTPTDEPTEPPTKTATPTVTPTGTPNPPGTEVPPETQVQEVYDCAEGAQERTDPITGEKSYWDGPTFCGSKAAAATHEPFADGLGGGGETEGCPDCPETHQDETVQPNSVMAIWHCEDSVFCEGTVTLVGNRQFVLQGLNGEVSYPDQTLGIDGQMYYTLEGAAAEGQWYVTDPNGARIALQKYISCSVSAGPWQTDSQGRFRLMSGNTQADVVSFLRAQGYFYKMVGQGARAQLTFDSGQAEEFAFQLSQIGPGGSLYLPGHSLATVDPLAGIDPDAPAVEPGSQNQVPF